MCTVNPQEVLEEISSIEEGNLFLEYIVKRVQRKDYRGWHISQHNRYDLDDIKIILSAIYKVVGKETFAIPPGDYHKNYTLSHEYKEYQIIVNLIKSEIGKGTINSIKKNFFPDLDRMGFLRRTQTPQGFSCGELTPSAVEFIEAKTLVDRYKKFTDGIDKLFGNTISELAEMIHLSDYSKELISIYEFMFILSDSSEEVDKIKILDSYRSLAKYKRKKVINLLKKYANPDNFSDKSSARDFHNWKNQTQQIMNLLKTTVYFDVDKNKSFRLNSSRETGFFHQPKRSEIPKREYFKFHQISKRNDFELHHIVPISSARNTEEARIVDDYRNLIYLHKNKHKEISRNRNENLVLSIDPDKAIFSDFDDKNKINAKNDADALYSKKNDKIEKLAKHNTDLLKSIFDFEKYIAP